MTVTPSQANFLPQLTADGSYTFFSQEFDEAFHSSSGAKQEAEKKFIKPCQIAEKALKKSSLKILDICYGLGYNTAAALEVIWQVNPDCQVELIALELDKNVPNQAIAYQLLKKWKSPLPELLTALAQNKEIKAPKIQAELLIGDARLTIKEVIKKSFPGDAIFLDPFSPTKCPQLWTVEFLAQVAKCLAPDGRLATYSCSAAVRSALLLAGLNIASTEGIGRRSPGTIASFVPISEYTLSLKEQEHLQTTAAIPYRDPTGTDSAFIISSRRQKEQQNTDRETTSQWKKRWKYLES